jgi:hypothetical protein
MQLMYATTDVSHAGIGALVGKMVGAPVGALEGGLVAALEGDFVGSASLVKLIGALVGALDNKRVGSLVAKCDGTLVIRATPFIGALVGGTTEIGTLVRAFAMGALVATGAVVGEFVRGRCTGPEIGATLFGDELPGTGIVLGTGTLVVNAALGTGAVDGDALITGLNGWSTMEKVTMVNGPLTQRVATHERAQTVTVCAPKPNCGQGWNILPWFPQSAYGAVVSIEVVSMPCS